MRPIGKKIPAASLYRLDNLTGLHLTLISGLNAENLQKAHTYRVDFPAEDSL
jgi:hypothetical protein